MGSLYDRLEVRSTATKEDIRQNYKQLAYRYSNSNNGQGLVEINAAKDILLDDYKRDFYDRYGDSQVSLLLRPAEGYLFSHYFTRFNIFCLYLACFMFLFNLSGLYYLFLFFDLNVFRFAPLITTPIFICLTVVRDSKAIRCCTNILEPFYSNVLNLAVLSSEVWFIALYFDNLVGLKKALVSVILLELLLIGKFHSQEKKYENIYIKSLVFRILKALMICLFFVPSFRFYMFIPAAIALSYSIVDKVISTVTFIPILAYTLIIYFYLDMPKWFVHPFIGTYIFGSMIAIYSIQNSFKKAPPVTFFDLINHQVRLPPYHEIKIELIIKK